MTPTSLSTGLFYGRAKAAMGGIEARATQLQTQIATGKRLETASDNSVAYERLQRIARATTDAGSYGPNLDLSASLLQQTDSTLDSVATQVGRAQELVMKARNGTLDATARKALGAELSTILDSVLQLANTTDTRGQPLFGGADGAAAVTRGADNRFTYSTGTPSAIPVADGQAIQSTESAERIFDLGGGKDMLSVLAALAGRLEIGASLDDDEGAQAIDDLAAASDQIAGVRGSVGARAARVDLVQAQATALAADRELERSGLEDTDLTAAITELQQQMTVLSATQASFSKLSSLSLFDYLR